MRKFVLFTMALIILSGYVYSCTSNTSTTHLKTDDEMEATLSPPNRVVASLPAVLTLELSNSSPEPVNLPWPKWIDQFITSEIKSPDGKVQKIRHSGLSLGHCTYPGGDVAPEEVVTIQLSQTFPTEGRYEIKCILDTTGLKGHNMWGIWEGCVESNRITLNVQKRD